MTSIPAMAAQGPVSVPAATAVSNNAPLTKLVAQKDSIVLIEQRINALRAQHGLDALQFNAIAATEAADWSTSMASKKKVSHTGWEDYDPRMLQYQNRWENVARGATASAQPADLFAQWTNSRDGHLEAMLDSRATSFGVGFVKGADGLLYGTLVMYQSWDDAMPETYATTADYFAGKAPLPVSGTQKVVTPKPVTFNATGQTYTVPSVPGVRYYDQTRNAFVPAGTHRFYDDPYQVIIALPQPGYVLNSAANSEFMYSHHDDKDFLNPGTPKLVNTATEHYIQLPVVAGVEYSVNGTKAASDRVNVSRTGTHTVTAKVASWASSYTVLTRYFGGWTFEGGTTAITNARPVSINAGASTYTVPKVTGLNYLVNDAVVSPGTYTAEPGQSIKVRVAPQAGYSFHAGTQFASNFAVDYQFPGVKVVEPISVVAAAPTFNVSARSYTVPSTTGVSYQVNGTAVAAGTKTLSDTAQTVKITAHAAAGYQLSGTSSWSQAYAAKETPATSVTATAPTFNVSARTYTIPAKTGVVYKVNGTTAAAGTKTLSDAAQTVAITAHAATGYVLSGTSSWSQSYAVKEAPLTSVVAAAPTFNVSARSYTIPAKAGVAYKVNGVAAAAGTKVISDAAQTVTITAHAATGYVLSGTSSWAQSYAVKPVALKSVAATAPTFNTTARTYTIPAKTGVAYKVNGKAATAGVKTVSNTAQTVKITAHAATGYKLTGTTSWSKAYAAKPLVTAATKAPAFNTAARTYTIPSVKGVSYKVNGKATTAGVKTVSNAKQTITITAHAATGYKLSGTAKWAKAYAVKLVVVKTKAPAFNTTARTYTIPSVKGVSYKVNGKAVPAGVKTISNAKQTITITAHAASGYKLSGTAKWAKAYAVKVVVVKTKAPAFNTTARTYTIPSVKGIAYKVNGKATTAGVKKITKSAQTVKITAHAASGYKLSGTTSWSKAYKKG